MWRYISIVENLWWIWCQTYGIKATRFGVCKWTLIIISVVSFYAISIIWIVTISDLIRFYYWHIWYVLIKHAHVNSILSIHWSLYKRGCINGDIVSLKKNNFNNHSLPDNKIYLVLIRRSQDCRIYITPSDPPTENPAGGQLYPVCYEVVHSLWVVGLQYSVVPLCYSTNEGYSRNCSLYRKQVLIVFCVILLEIN